MKKKILYVITKSVWGGAQKYVYDLATHLPLDQFDVTVITGAGGPLVDKLRAAQIKTIPLPTLQESSGFSSVVLAPINIVALFRLVAIFKKERPDVVHLNSSKVGGLGAVAAKLASWVTGSRCRVIFTAHGWGFEEDRPRFERAAIWFLSWLASIFQDKIILIDTADYRAARRFIPERRLILISNGIEPIEFIPAEAARQFFAKATGRDATAGRVLIGTIAELTNNKGLTHLIDAVNLMRYQVSGVRCQVIAVGEGEERKNLENRIRSLGLEGTVHLAGFVPEAARYLKAFDVFVLPSVKEGLPYTIMEAMAAGVPVVASRVGGIPDLIEHGKSGILVPPKDPNALAQALLDLLDRPERGRSLAQKARARLENDFRLDAMIARTQAIYLHA